MLLHKHNKKTYNNIQKKFYKSNRVAVVQPTGAGKSFLIMSPSTYIFSQIKTHAEDNNITIDNC